MNSNISKLSDTIHSCFKDTKLLDGISWREADVLDNYGSLDKRNAARAMDEKENWEKVPFSLIEDLKLQCVMPFLDAKGLRFYLPICMLYGLTEYKTSNSLMLDSLLYSLGNKKTSEELKKILNKDQIKCVHDYLQFCLIIGDDYFDTYNLEDTIHNYWKHS